MSLSDLKNKKVKSKVTKLSIDDFIEDALVYSQGKSNLSHQGKAVAKKVRGKENVRSKRATFSLSDPCIKQLGELAEQTGINKSKLIRLIVNQTILEDSDFLKDQPSSDKDPNKD